MKIAFRVDSSATIGAGHLMRCLNLADAMKKAGAVCLFASCGMSDAHVGLIKQRGHLYCEVSDDCRLKRNNPENDQRFCWEHDAAQSSTIFEEYSPDWIVVDHYQISHLWEERVKNEFSKILVIDDFANRKHACHILVDSNVGRQKSDYQHLLPKTCTVLVGASYIMLDRECYVKPAERRTGTVVFLGGGDNEFDLNRLLPALPRSTLPGPVTVVVGSSQPNPSGISKACQKFDFFCEVNPENFKSICRTARLAIARCGLVSYELAAFKTPSICFWRHGIHKRVAHWLEQSNFVVASKIDDFVNCCETEIIVRKALSLKPSNRLQTEPGQDKIARILLQ